MAVQESHLYKCDKIQYIAMPPFGTFADVRGTDHHLN
jgi:hypothetical protein